MIELVVTRHKALVEYLKKLGYIDDNTQVIEHATPEDVDNKVVAGVLPHSLSTLCKFYIEVSLKIPPELRGKELSVDDISMYQQGIKAYRVLEYPILKVIKGEIE